MSNSYIHVPNQLRRGSRKLPHSLGHVLLFSLHIFQNSSSMCDNIGSMFPVHYGLISTLKRIHVYILT